MKTLLLTLLLVPMMSFGQVPSYVPTNGLVGWFPFSGDVADSSGNNIDGTLFGAPTLSSDRFLHPNSCYEYNGNGDYVNFGDANSFEGGSELTISFWFKSSDLGQNAFADRRPIISKWFSTTTMSECSYNITMNGTDLLVSYSDGISFSTDSIPLSLMPNINMWYHVVMTFANGNSKIYLDSNLESDVPLGITSINNSNEDFKIGDWYYDNNNTYSTFFGKIDDVGIWNRELNQQEIIELYNSCTPTLSSITDEGLDSYTAPSGTVYTTGGVYTDTILNAAGCDSIITIDLSLNYTGIGELNNTPKQLIKIVDVLGRETPFKPNTPLLYIYNDGTVERKMIIKE